MFSKKSLIAFLTLLIIAVFSIQITAQRGMGMGMNQNCRATYQLNLTEEQQDKFQEMRYEHMKEVEKYRAQIRQNMLEIKQMLNSGKADRDALTSLTDKNFELRSKIRNSAQNLWFDLYDDLDANQKELWTEFAGKKGFGPFGKGMRMGRGQGFGPFGKGMRMGRGQGFGNWYCPGYGKGFIHRGRYGYGPGNYWYNPKAPRWNND